MSAAGDARNGPDLDHLPLPAAWLTRGRVASANAAALDLVPTLVGRTLADGEAILPGRDADAHLLVHVRGDLATLTDVGDFHARLSAMTKVSNAVLGSAEGFRESGEVLERLVRERTADLRRANEDAVTMLAIASEAKDGDTGEHVRRVRRTTTALARELGSGDAEARRIGLAAVLHDVGKIHVPDAVLKKPGKLDPDERRVIERHTVDGERILADSPFFAEARQIARSHHENFDGTGYPDRLAGEDIPMPARIVHVADVFDALTNKRVYKPAWTEADAAQTLVEGSGLSFDPEVITVFKKLFDDGYFSPQGDPAQAAE